MGGKHIQVFHDEYFSHRFVVDFSKVMRKKPVGYRDTDMVRYLKLYILKAILIRKLARHHSNSRGCARGL